MPTRPTIKQQTKVYSSVGMLRAIFNDPNNDLLYRQRNVDATTASIRAAGEFITAFKPRANQFINALVNRIGMERITYLMWSNPWSWAKQGKLELGETVEEIWLGLAKAYVFNPEKSETRFLKREEPDVLSAFHSVNYRIFYKITVTMQQLKTAFLSVDGLINFVESLIASTGRSASADEYMVMKYTLAIALLNGNVKTVKIPAITKENAEDVITAVTTVTNNFQFPLASMQYNRAGVQNTVNLDDTFILESTDANALIKVNALANAFNIDEVKFMGHVVMHDGLGNYDWGRMRDLFSEDPSFEPFNESQIAMLNSVKIIAMSRRFLQIYDNYEYMGEPLRNGEGLFENYFYHVGKVLSTSPFHACVAFTNSADGELTVTISPQTASVTAGQSVSFLANVVSTGFQVLDVTWTVTGGGDNTWIENGILHVGSDATGNITVTATCMGDPTKSATATVTVVE